MTNADGATLDIAKTWVSQSLTHDRPLMCCRFSPCGKYVVAGGHDEFVQRWDLASRKVSLTGHTSWVTSVAFHPDQQRLFSVDIHGTLICWPYAADAPQPQWTVKNAHPSWIRAVAVSLDGNTIATAGASRTIKLWSAADGKPTGELTGDTGDIFSLAFHPDGKSLASGDLFGKIHHWELVTGKVLRTLDASLLHTRGEDFIADVGGVRSIAFDATGELMACSGLSEAKSNTFCPGTPAGMVFDWASGAVKTRLRVKQAADGPVNAIRFLSDGTIVGYDECLTNGTSLLFWKSDGPDPIHELNGTSGYSIDIHPDGLRLAVAMFEPNGRGGNGRHSKPEEYASNKGKVDIYSLFAKPATPAS